MAIRNITGSFTRPANTTAYASGDLVANSTTAGSVAAVELTHVGHTRAGAGIVRRVVLSKTSTGVTNTDFRVHFFRADPSTVTNGDNGAFSVSGVSDYLGAADVSITQAFTDGAWGAGAPNVGSEFMVRLGPALISVYALVEARAAYTPTSGETFTIGIDLIDEAG